MRAFTMGANTNAPDPNLLFPITDSHDVVSVQQRRENQNETALQSIMCTRGYGYEEKAGILARARLHQQAIFGGTVVPATADICKKGTKRTRTWTTGERWALTSRTNGDQENPVYPNNG